ncbi:MAG: MlaC/ttg2D family ABC transporter substrate-binding protein [Alphaproteobacteria bacterium]
MHKEKALLSKKLLLSVCTLALLPASLHAMNASLITMGKDTSQVVLIANSIEDEAQGFISNLSEQGIGFLQNKDISQEEREKEFRKLLQNNFDMKTIGRFALGRYWKTSSKEQQNEYLDLFENMIVNVYSRRFSEYNGEALTVKSARPEGKADVLVQSSIIPANGSEVSVDWRVRKKKNGQFKVIDIMVEGVSMSLTQRSDFASVIQRGGGNIDVLLAHLRK